MYYDIFKELNKLEESQENKLEEVFETHSTLNQKLFDQNILREDVRKQMIYLASVDVLKRLLGQGVEKMVIDRLNQKNAETMGCKVVPIT